jgi:hypothetical protein
MGEIFKRNWKKVTGVRAPRPLKPEDVLRLLDQGLLTTNASGIAGIPIDASTIPSGTVLIFNGTEWVAGAADAVFGGKVTVSGLICGLTPPLLTVAQDVNTAINEIWFMATSGINLPSGAFGPAGGDLTGTYPNPTVSGIQNVEVAPNTPLLGQVLSYDGTRYVPVTPAAAAGAGFVTVGGSGTSEHLTTDYSTLGAAIAAGHRSIDVVSDTIESANVVIAASGAHVRMHNATIHLLTNSIQVGPGLTVTGRGTVIGNGGSLFTSALANSELRVNGIDIDGKNATSTVINIGSPTQRVRLENTTIQQPASLNGSVAVRNGRIQDVRVEGNGNTSWAFNFQGSSGRPGLASNITIAGTWAGNNSCMFFQDDNLRLDGLFFDAVNPVNLRFLLNAANVSLSNIHRADGFIAWHPASTLVSNLTMDNCRAEFGVFPAAGGTRDSHFSNCVASGSRGLLSSNAQASRNLYSNCKLGQPGSLTTATIWGDDNHFDGVVFEEPVLVRGSGHIFSNCRFRKALTIDTNASGVLISDCSVQGAFTDNGTDTAGSIV